MDDVNSAERQFDQEAELDQAAPESAARPKPDKEQPVLTKAALAELLFDQIGLNKREAQDMVETFFDEIRTALERGEAVRLSGFGNFQLRDKAERPGRNPKTGEVVTITARRVVTFHPCQSLKSACQADLPSARVAPHLSLKSV